MTLHYLCIYGCIRGYNCCQTGSELSKCVYLASMGVKINQTTGGQNQRSFSKLHISWSCQSKHGPQPRQNCENLCFCLSKRIFSFHHLSSHLSPLTSEVVGAPQMTLQQYLSTLPYLLLPSRNLQTPFPSIP